MKNVLVFKFKELDKDQLAAALENNPLEDIKSFETFKIGFSKVNDTEFLHKVGNEIYSACFSITEKKLSNAAVNQQLQKIIKKIKEVENREVYKKEKQTLKEDIIFENTPKVLPVTKSIDLLFDFKNKLILIGTSSQCVADEILSSIRNCLDSLKVSLISTKNLDAALQNCVKENVFGSDYELGESCDLSGIDSENIKLRNVSLIDNTAIDLINAGYKVDKVQMINRHGLSFNVDKNLKITNCKALPEFIEKLDDIELVEDFEKYQDASNLLFCGVIVNFVNVIESMQG